MAYLVVNDGSEKGNHINLPAASEVFIGRSTARSDVIIPAGSVSGRHCLLAIAPGSFTLKDLDSTNGTYVNGARITEEKVFRGDTITLGDVQMVLMGADVPERKVAAAPEPEAAVESAPLEAGSRTAGRAPAINVTSHTVKVLPASFKKKRANGWMWGVLIVVSAIVAMVLLYKLITTLNG